MLAPRSFNLYKKLEKFDMVIYIEHCHNCQHHNVSVRHDLQEYVRYSDKFLRILGQVSFQSVQLKYTTDEIEVMEVDCMGINGYGSNGSNSNHVTLPESNKFLLFDL
jgi:glutathionyl-hydroquinone reductase